MASDQKKADDEGATLFWIDESSFYLLPMAVHTYAPVKQTPLLRVKLTRDHLSAISALGMDGRLFFQMQNHSYDSAGVVVFLQELLQQVPGKIVVIWDGAPIHRSKAIKAFLAAGVAHRLHLERLPGYAPELNPDEGIWNALKRGELKNHCFATMSHLADGILQAHERLLARPDVVLGCLKQCHYLFSSECGDQ